MMLHAVNNVAIVSHVMYLFMHYLSLSKNNIFSFSIFQKDILLALDKQDIV